MDRRNFFQRLAVLAPAIALVDRFKTPELPPADVRRFADLKNIELAHPMRYLRSIHHIDENEQMQTWTETSDSVNGPWVRLANNDDGTLQAYHYPPMRGLK